MTDHAKNPKAPKAHAISKATALERIAVDLLGIETLKTRHSDDLDFHDLAVWKIRDALAAAYEAGYQARKFAHVR